MVSGQRTVMIPVMHMWTAMRESQHGLSFCPPVAGKGRSQEQQLVKWGMEGAKKREVGHTSFLVLDVPICRGVPGCGVFVCGVLFLNKD